MSHYYSDIGMHKWTQYTLSTAALMWVHRHRTAIAAHPWRQICRRDKLSTIFTINGVKKSVSARRLLGLDRVT